MQANASHMLRLLRQSEKFLDIKQNKNFFLTYSKTLFVYTVLRPMSYAPFLCRINVSWRYTIVASFICIAFVVLKLKIFKDFCTESASMKWLFFIGGGGEGGLCPYSLKYCPSSLIFLTEVVFKGRTTTFKETEIGIFTKTRSTQNLHFWSDFDPTPTSSPPIRFPLKMAKIDYKSHREKSWFQNFSVLQLTRSF